MENDNNMNSLLTSPTTTATQPPPRPCSGSNSRGGDIDVKNFIAHADNAGWTALHHAAANGKTRVVELLLDNGSNVHDKSKNDGSTPLSLAISNSHLDVAYILIDNGASLLQEEEYNSNKGKTTPLDMAPTLEMKDALLEYSQRNKVKVVMHQIEKLLANVVKMGHTTLNYNNSIAAAGTSASANSSSSTFAVVTMHQRAGKRPRPRW